MEKITEITLVYLKISEKKMKHHPFVDRLKDFSSTEISDHGAFICLYAWSADKKIVNEFVNTRNSKYFVTNICRLNPLEYQEFQRTYGDFEIEKRYLTEDFELTVRKNKNTIGLCGTVIEFDFVEFEYPESLLIEYSGGDVPIGYIFKSQFIDALRALQYPIISMDDLISGVMMCDEKGQMQFDDLVIFLDHFGFLLSDETFFTFWTYRKVLKHESI